MAISFHAFNMQPPNNGQAQTPPPHGGFLRQGVLPRHFPMQRPQPNCRITSTDDGVLQDKIKINCDCTCNYEQTDTVLLGRDTSITNCDARQMNQINILRAMAGRR